MVESINENLFVKKMFRTQDELIEEKEHLKKVIEALERVTGKFDCNKKHICDGKKVCLKYFQTTNDLLTKKVNIQ